MPYSSPIPMHSSPVRAAVVHCSDGRFTEHTADFVRQELGIHAADLVVLPGGPACLAGHPSVTVSSDRVTEELKFLVDAHDLNKVVLVSHQNCGLYGKAGGLSDSLLEEQQKADLSEVARRIRDVMGISDIEAWFLRIVDGEVVFDQFGLV